LFCGRTFSALGAIPKLHCNIAPEVTSCGISGCLASYNKWLFRVTSVGLRIEVVQPIASSRS
jgi:hypothetical protein